MNSSDFIFKGKFTFNTTEFPQRKPIELSYNETLAVLSGYKAEYNVSDNINISINISTTNVSFTVLCLSSTNTVLVNKAYNSSFNINGDTL